MGLKQDIVIVNEFTMKAKSLGGKGTRGSTPGDYVLRYMARDLATEVATPIRRTEIQDYIYRYAAREEAAENLEIDDTGELKTTMAKAQGKGGVAFGYGTMSLSHDALIAAKNDIQQWYDKGHTVLKTVLSFDTDYLKSTGVLPEDFEVENPGDFRGHLDQAKLRLAIMSGLEKMSRSYYDDMRYVGVIQVDTEHVHAHLAIVDAGVGRLTPEGTQKGKINEVQKRHIRRGIDDYLDEMQTVKHLSSSVGYERRNVAAYVKRWAFHHVSVESPLQFLIACLPEDRSMWSATTNRKQMRKANAVAREYVEEILAYEDSPLARVKEEIVSYVDYRTQREDLSREERQKLIDYGMEKVINQAINGLYSMLRGYDNQQLRVMTPTLDVMSMDYEQLMSKVEKSDDELTKFSYRMRSYATRRDFHKSKLDDLREKRNDWQKAYDSGVASQESVAVRDHYDVEIEFHEAAYMKYMYFLPPAIYDDGWYEDWKAVEDYSKKYEALRMMMRDESLRKLSDESEAERRGTEIYGQHGGSLVAKDTQTTRRMLADRLEAMGKKREELIQKLEDSLASRGLKGVHEAFDYSDLTIENGLARSFNEVKGVDLHHLGYDFARDVEIGRGVRDDFLDLARRRKDAYFELRRYLKITGQDSAIRGFDGRDIQRMSRTAMRLRRMKNPELVSDLHKLYESPEAYKRTRTVSLDTKTSKKVQREVEDSVQKMKIEEIFEAEVQQKGRDIGREI